jgi:hypothetical protein
MDNRPKIKNTANKPELRKFPRFCQSMLVKIKNGSQHSGRTLDVSENGAKIEVSRPIAVGERLQLELFFRDTDPFPIRLVGDCRWSELGDRHQTVAGVDLSPSHSRSLAVLNDYLALKNTN